MRALFLALLLAGLAHPGFAQIAKQKNFTSGDGSAAESRPTETVPPAPGEHLRFLGVPIDGTLDDFVDAIRQKGFSVKGKEDGFALLEGDFAAYKTCTIGVATLQDKDLVNHVGVLFPEQDTWAGLSGDYFHLKELLTEKYGEPADSVEEFNRYEPDSDRGKMNEVYSNDCRFRSTFRINSGQIVLSIFYEGSLDAMVRLDYYDAINTGEIRERAIDDL